MNHDVVIAVKLSAKLVSSLWEHMNDWKRVVFNGFNMIDSIIKSFLLFVEWNIIKPKNYKCFGYLNHHFVTAVKLVIKLFLVYVSIWITGIECFPIVLMCWIQISNHFCFWLSERSNIKQYVFLLCEPAFCHWL